jgi:hypothetical protein
MFHMWSEMRPMSRRAGTHLCADSIDGYRSANLIGYEEYPASGRSPDATGLLYAPKDMVDEVARQVFHLSLNASAEWPAERARQGAAGRGRPGNGHLSELVKHLKLGAPYASQLIAGVYACVQLGLVITTFVPDEVVCKAGDNEFHKLRLFTIKAKYSAIPYGIKSVHVPLLMVDTINGVHQSYETGLSGVPAVHSVGISRAELGELRDVWRRRFMALRPAADAAREAAIAMTAARSSSGVNPDAVVPRDMVVDSIPWGSLTEECSSPVSSNGDADVAAAEAAVASARGRREGSFPPHAGAGPEPAAAVARRASGRVTGAPDWLQVGHVLFSSPFGQGEDGMPTPEGMGSPTSSHDDLFEECDNFLGTFDAD